MVEEEGAVMGGLLVGLNVIDANLCIKGEDLDTQVSADGLRGASRQSCCISFSPLSGGSSGTHSDHPSPPLGGRH